MISVGFINSAFVREEADFRSSAVSSTDSIRAINVPQGGRQIVRLIAIRHRGYSGAIRVSAKDLPGGIDCPDVWFGPGVNHATMVVSADPNCEQLAGRMQLEAAEITNTTISDMMFSSARSFGQELRMGGGDWSLKCHSRWWTLPRSELLRMLTSPLNISCTVHSRQNTFRAAR